ncbi:MAG: hypothetical protein Q9208_005119 [Pyrenodesmia sp. 3 TL-2023]
MSYCLTFRPWLLPRNILRQYASFGRGSVRMLAAHLPPRLVIPEEHIEESFLKGSGPGGQKIVRFSNSPLTRSIQLILYGGKNKTSSAVQLKHIPTGMVVKSQATRSRSQNRSIARRLLADKLEDARKGPESRTAMKTEVKRKKKASKTKKARRKHRAHDEDGDEDAPASETDEADEKAGGTEQRPRSMA